MRRNVCVCQCGGERVSGICERGTNQGEQLLRDVVMSTNRCRITDKYMLGLGFDIG